MKKQIIFNIVNSGYASALSEVFTERGAMLQALLGHLEKLVASRTHFLNEKGKKQYWAKWRPRLKKARKDPRRIWPAYLIFQKQRPFFARAGSTAWCVVNTLEVNPPKEIVEALRLAHMDLVEWHRVLWHSNKRTRGGMRRQALCKTIVKIMRILDPHDPICKGGAK